MPSGCEHSSEPLLSLNAGNCWTSCITVSFQEGPCFMELIIEPYLRGILSFIGLICHGMGVKLGHSY